MGAALPAAGRYRVHAGLLLEGFAHEQAFAVLARGIVVRGFVELACLVASMNVEFPNAGTAEADRRLERIQGSWK
ncbi:hypothetical protein AOC05_08320 [Arthrobacter alpinus]|uniref:Uncharacterized protein n=1 Tax=Arthrobacter alpinus TaxID=656366 RepID=A0A0M3UG20_9MICC|nr:hypothetical protein [Arthrobacter alpinus]ALE92325.1 hypothetical protein AOC05_08320 [Arthrobacter alpinus]